MAGFLMVARPWVSKVDGSRGMWCGVLLRARTAWLSPRFGKGEFTDIGKVHMSLSHPFMIWLTITVALLLAYRLWSGKLRRPVESASVLVEDRIDSASEIESWLREVCETGPAVSIIIEGRGTVFEAPLRRVDTGGNPPGLLIGGLWPPEGDSLIADSRFVKVVFRKKEGSHGRLRIPYSFSALYQREEIVDEKRLFRISVPHVIDREQKRNFLRVTPAFDRPVQIQFDLGERRIEANVANIGGGGLGFYTDLPPSELKRGTMLEHVKLTIPDAPSIDCMAVVFTLEHVEKPHFIGARAYRYYCGTEFVNMNDDDREWIIQYVILTERQELKRFSKFRSEL